MGEGSEYRGGLAGTADSIVRPLAKALDADKMAKLGIRNTMRLAKLYNGAVNGGRQKLRAARRDALLPAVNGGPRFEDGFMLDSSMSLPQLDELLAAGDEIIAERAGNGEADDRYRAFFRNMVSVADLERWPALLDFVSTPELIAPVADYLGFVPALSGTLPTGVRMVESGKHLDALAHLPPRDSQVFHIDPYDHPMVYVLVLLEDVGERQGPFTWLPASTSARATERLAYWDRGRPYRLEDDEIYSVVDPAETRRLTGPRGTVLFIDTSRCFHFGARDGEEPRYQAMYGLTSVTRSDFSESYLPLDAHAAYLNGAGELRRLVLDRRAG